MAAWALTGLSKRGAGSLASTNARVLFRILVLLKTFTGMVGLSPLLYVIDHGRYHDRCYDWTIAMTILMITATIFNGHIHDHCHDHGHPWLLDAWASQDTWAAPATMPCQICLCEAQPGPWIAFECEGLSPWMVFECEGLIPWTLQTLGSSLLDNRGNSRAKTCAQT